MDRNFAVLGHFFGICRLRDYSALRASPTRFARGRRRYAPAFNVAARRCRTLLVFLSGVRIEAKVLWNQMCGVSDMPCGICRLRDYSALRASPTRFARGRRRYAPAFNVAARRCRTLLVFLSGVRIVADVRWNVILRCLGPFCGVMPAEGFEPPTYGLQNRCTTTVLSRHSWTHAQVKAPHSTLANGVVSKLDRQVSMVYTIY